MVKLAGIIEVGLVVEEEESIHPTPLDLVDSSTIGAGAGASGLEVVKEKKVRRHKGKTKITKTKRRKFLAALCEMPNVSRACRRINVSRTAMYALKNKNEVFNTEWESAMVEGAEVMEEHAWNRATDEKKPSDILTIFMLKALKPEKYREGLVLGGETHAKARITHVLVNIPDPPILPLDGHLELSDGVSGADEDIIEAEIAIDDLSSLS